MDNKRNRIIKFKEFLISLGIKINIGKTSARGNKGFFQQKCNILRIDISKELDEENIFPVLLHEFAHYIHYTYDKSLSSLEFLFDDYSDEIKEELIKITVNEVPKDFAKSLYDRKNALEIEIKNLDKKIKMIYPDFKLSQKNLIIEKKLPTYLKYLLKYDKVKISDRIFSVNKLSQETVLNDIERDYIILKSKQRLLKRVNSKIYRLNKYYNNPSELFARFVELYYSNNEAAKKIAPLASAKLEGSNIPLLKKLENILS